MSLVLKEVRNGSVESAAQKLDATLCGDVLRLDSELATADPVVREYVEANFKHMARTRPQISEFAVEGKPDDRSSDRLAAQRILNLAARTDGAAK
jgi:hypothetical protein